MSQYIQTTLNRKVLKLKCFITTLLDFSAPVASKAQTIGICLKTVNVLEGKSIQWMVIHDFYSKNSPFDMITNYTLFHPVHLCEYPECPRMSLPHHLFWFKKGLHKKRKETAICFTKQCYSSHSTFEEKLSCRKRFLKNILLKKKKYTIEENTVFTFPPCRTLDPCKGQV